MTIACGSVSLAAQQPSEGSVTGFVRYASGGPVADVRVVLVRPGDNTARSTRTRPDGSFRIDAIAPGDYQLSASLPGGVAKLITVTAGSDQQDLNFSIPDGGSRRVVTARIVMNDASRGRPTPGRIGIGVLRSDGTLAVPMAPGDQRLVVRLPDGYFLDSVTHGSVTVYSLERVGGRRLTAGAFVITVLPEPQPIPELVVTLGSFPP
jgi:hypothetical protein